MRKVLLAILASVFIVPVLFWSTDVSAQPNFARKYGTSCYTCHSGFPATNSFGEAFKANGYRWPGGEDEAKTKIDVTELGAEAYKKTFPNSTWPSDIPGIAPFAVWVRGNLLEWEEEVTLADDSVEDEVLDWGGPSTGSILVGGTLGENLGILGVMSSRGGDFTTSLRALWTFAPGVVLSLGNANSFFLRRGGVFPSPGTGVEMNIVRGQEGGYNILGGVSNANGSNGKNLTDARYLRAKYKFGGSGLLSGSGGTLGNPYVGLDNNIEIEASFFQYADDAIPGRGNFAGESTFYGADLSGSYGSFTGGVAVSRMHDLDMVNMRADAEYFFYPWLKGSLRYSSYRDGENPALSGGLTAHVRPNVSIGASYSHPTKSLAPDGDENQDSFRVSVGASF